MKKYKYTIVAVGGTFDRFHKGHKMLLSSAFSVGQRVFVGITSDEMVRNKELAAVITPFATRQKEVASFLAKQGWGARAKLVKLTDPYGPLKTDGRIEAVIVGPKFSPGIINSLKKKIYIIHCPTVYDDSHQYLSSTHIRLGEVNRNGVRYTVPQKDLFLPASLRPILQKPLGVMQTFPSLVKRPIMVISVGDIATQKLNQLNRTPDIAIVDYYVQRKKKFSSLKELGFPSNTKETVIVKNPAGTLHYSLTRALQQSIARFIQTKARAIIKVEGEEDLAVLPGIVLSPLSSLVIYGQPPFSPDSDRPTSEGLVVVEVTEEKKEEIKSLLDRFTLSS